MALRFLELPGRTPPLPIHQSGILPRDRGHRQKHSQRVWRQIQPQRLDLGHDQSARYEN